MAMLVFVIMEEDETSASQLKGSIDWQCTSLGRSYVVKTFPLRERDFKDKPSLSSRTGLRELLCDCLKEFCGHRLEDKSRQSESGTLVLLPSSTLVEKDFVSELCSKISEYGDVVLCSSGYRVFPHPKEEPGTGSSYQERNIALYDELSEDRPLHIFAASSVVVVPMSAGLLHQFCSACPEFSSLGHWWASFVINTCTGNDMWKVKLKSLKVPFQSPAWSGNELSEKFYHFLYDSNWPLGVSDPFCKCDFPLAVPSETPTALWKNGFKGFNMLSEPASELDLADAVFYGAKVVRCGAVGDAKDLQYLISSKALSVVEDQVHLDKVIPRLRKALQRIDSFGLRAILTFSDLPGCSFYSRNGSEFDFFLSPAVRNRISQFWGYLVSCIADLKHCIAAYDLLNEPYTKPDTLAGFFDTMPSDGADILNTFYRETVALIRKSDSDTVIILKPLNWGSPQAIVMLNPIPDDSNIAYGFHMYGPTTITQTTEMAPQIGYPGIVKGHRFNKQVISEVLCSVHKWQRAHAIGARKIVCTEFGCGRLVPGCSHFLSDLVMMFNEFGWSWLLFSFRDPEWHSMDYELGTDPNNFLFRQRSPLLHVLFEAN